MIKKLVIENRGILLFIGLMLIFRSSIADWSDVPTGSMKPTIQEGDRIIIDKLAYDLKIPFTQISIKEISDPRSGDIIVFDSAAAGKRLVKRVIGVPGDQVSLIKNRLHVNGKSFDYQLQAFNDDSAQFIESNGMQLRLIQINGDATHDKDFANVQVPDDHYLVLGDNRNNSVDSRFYGFIPKKEIIGKATRVAFSLDYEHYFLPRIERTNQPLI